MPNSLPGQSNDTGAADLARVTTCTWGAGRYVRDKSPSKLVPTRPRLLTTMPHIPLMYIPYCRVAGCLATIRAATVVSYVGEALDNFGKDDFVYLFPAWSA